MVTSGRPDEHDARNALPRPGIELGRPELVSRASRIRLVVSDCDGVWTDGGVFYSAQGEAMLRFSRRDGMGVELLGRAGIKTTILTREQSEIVAARAKKLALEQVFFGVWDKAAFLPRIEERTGIRAEEMAYIGDDVNDVEIMRAIGASGLVGAPVDAANDARAAAHFITRAPGGYGAFRDFADWILSLRRESEVVR